MELYFNNQNSICSYLEYSIYYDHLLMSHLIGVYNYDHSDDISLIVYFLSFW